MFKSYGNRKNALAGAKRAGIHNELVIELDGKWGFEVADEVVPAQQEIVPEAATPEPETAPVETEGTKRTIEKERPKQNGVTRPSAGGMCRSVWDFCDKLHSAEHLPTVGEVKAKAAELSWNVNNASIEYYQWRKFNGIRGRQQTAQANAPDAAAVE